MLADEVTVHGQIDANDAVQTAFRSRVYGSIVAGDVIQAVNDQAVADFDDMLTALERYQPGDRVTLTLWRAGRASPCITMARIKAPARV